MASFYYKKHLVVQQPLSQFFNKSLQMSQFLLAGESTLPPSPPLHSSPIPHQTHRSREAAEQRRGKTFSLISPAFEEKKENTIELLSLYYKNEIASFIRKKQG